MNSVLKDYVTSQKITNIFCVQKAWEDPDILDYLEPPYHLVVASLSLGMPDIRAAIKKMEAVACGDISLYWHAGTPGWEKMPRALWPTLFKTRYHTISFSWCSTKRVFIPVWTSWSLSLNKIKLLVKKLRQGCKKNVIIKFFLPFFLLRDYCKHSKH